MPHPPLGPLTIQRHPVPMLLSVPVSYCPHLSLPAGQADGKDLVTIMKRKNSAIWQSIDRKVRNIKGFKNKTNITWLMLLNQNNIMERFHMRSKGTPTMQLLCSRWWGMAVICYIIIIIITIIIIIIIIIIVITADVTGEDSWRWLRNGFLKIWS